MGDRKKQSMVGEVVSDGMQKTVVVQVTRKISHPVYKKYVKRFKKHLAHVESIQPKIGDTVKISSMRPMSKRKRWLVSEIIRESVKIG
jgi:small subunit ribosomal protein S17